MGAYLLVFLSFLGAGAALAVDVVRVVDAKTIMVRSATGEPLSVTVQGILVPDSEDADCEAEEAKAEQARVYVEKVMTGTVHLSNIHPIAGSDAVTADVQLDSMVPLAGLLTAQGYARYARDGNDDWCDG
ncbi:hypothetical protein [Govanella unica]|uniref:TNase-like domain-containing protein n=1 Tax=Govanella unica TaxID=2975056 RepID=A0A9X3Z8P3_9PROT|nr:hypothetical protein [Govania unica]MDA5195064.1 hypothetical protein [Govania unica]